MGGANGDDGAGGTRAGADGLACVGRRGADAGGRDWGCVWAVAGGTEGDDSGVGGGAGRDADVGATEVGGTAGIGPAPGRESESGEGGGFGVANSESGAGGILAGGSARVGVGRVGGEAGDCDCD